MSSHHQQQQQQQPLSPMSLEGIGDVGGDVNRRDDFEFDVVDDDDHRSIDTGMSALSHNTTTSKRSVLGDAFMILRGINPNDVNANGIPEEDEEGVRHEDDENDDGFASANDNDEEDEEEEDVFEEMEDCIVGKSVVLSKSSDNINRSNSSSKNRTITTATNGARNDRNLSSGNGSNGGVRFMNNKNHHDQNNHSSSQLTHDTSTTTNHRSSLLTEGGNRSEQSAATRGGFGSTNDANGTGNNNNISDRSSSPQYIDFLQDPVRTMTNGRKIAIFFIRKQYSWYYPRLKKKVKSSNRTSNSEQLSPLEEENDEATNMAEPMHPLLAASIAEQIKRISSNNNHFYTTSTSSKQTLSLSLTKKKSTNNNNSYVSYRQLIDAVSTSKSMEYEEENGDANQLQSCRSNVSHATNASTIEEQRLLLDGQYPFTHSRREQPNLEKAWAYFDHVALSRYILPPNHKQQNQPKKFVLTRIFRKMCCKANKKLERAEPGERTHPTALYEPLFTPHNQLGDFGLGIGLYFSTLRAITVLTLVATLLNIPNFLYYASSDYTPGISNFNSTGLPEFSSIPALLQGSAICTDVSWVVCPECNTTTSTSPGQYFPDNRRAYGFNPLTEMNVSDVFYLRNNCATPNFQSSMISYATILLILVGTIGLNLYLQKMEIAFDEDEQTAQDYSILISNPPGDATDPQEWHDFFYHQFDGIHVTACTVAVDNDLLVRSLVERREILRQIEMLVEPGTSLDTLTLAGIAAKQEKDRTFSGHVTAMFVRGIPELFARLTVLTAKVQGLAQQDYPATNVFVTFETELAQRTVLSAYNLGSIDVRRNNIHKLSNTEHLFRKQFILNVKEPDEPNTIRWQDLNVTAKAKLKQQLMTIIATLAAIALIAYMVFVLNNNDKSLRYTAFAIAISNSIFPQFAKFLTNCEAHSSEGNKQKSLFFKIALFRWVNTAVVITIITPFTATLTSGKLINQVYNLFIAEIITSNVILVVDPLEHIKRHILAPRAMTQDAMNLKMQGAVFELAERYTNMTKILFLALWYCTVYPGALLMCSFALFINYFVDRFALMRTWKRPPKLGTKISEFSRRYFLSVALLAMAVLASYYWAGFPFDNLCLIEDAESPILNNTTFTGKWSIRPFDATLNQTDIVFPTNTEMYQPCLQDFLRFPLSDRKYPFISHFQIEGEEWMTVDQELITDIFGWSSVGVLVIIFFTFMYRYYTGFMEMFRGSYEACGSDMGINFSDVASISSYVPEVQSPVISYPLLACHIDRIDKELLEWTDPDRPHTFYDLTKDADVLLRGTDVSAKVVFSQIGHWPPPPPKEQQLLNRSGSVDFSETNNM